MQSENTNHVLYLLVKKLGIPVTKQTIDDEIFKHPAHNSLLAMSNLLTNWNVPNAAYEIAFDDLKNLSDPFVAFFGKEGFLLVHGISEKGVVVSNEHLKNHVLSTEDFKKTYSGSVLIAQKDEESGERDYIIKRRREISKNLRSPIIYTAVVGLFLFAIFSHSNYITSLNLRIGLLTIFNSLGIVSTVLLLIQSIDANNPFIQKLCKGGNNKDCNAILSSKAAKVFDVLSWAEVGFVYFAGTEIVLIFNSDNVNFLSALALINIISLPYTFYSIYYQWRVAKHWCIFCCSVQIILWLEFACYLPYVLRGAYHLNTIELANLLIGFVFPAVIWMIIKPYLLLQEQMQAQQQELRKFKYNTKLFKKLLADGTQHLLPSENNSIIIGNAEAKHTITMISDPYCQPCARTHSKLDDWISSRDDIKLQIVFFTPTDAQNKKTKAATHLMSLKSNGDDSFIKKALNDWYEQRNKNYVEWAKSYPSDNIENQLIPLEAQRAWCRTIEIKGTPTILINGRKLPPNYYPEDIKYFF